MMMTRVLDFEEMLYREERQQATVNKYLHDVRDFLAFLGTDSLCKDLVMAYKKGLAERYAPAGVNSRLVAINRFLAFIGRTDCRVRLLKIQRQIFANEDREMSVEDYKRLVRAAQDSRIGYVIQTIGGTGIRVSELQYITVEAVELGKAVVSCKNKTRVILIPTQIQSLLKRYIRKAGVTSGSVFVTSGGKPLHRSNIWREMKALCERAGVTPTKVFPHNLRHLFARTFYGIEKDIVRLADMLGHSSINTTRIYTVETGKRHRQSLEQMSRLLLTT